MQWKRILSPNWEIQMSSNAIMCRIFLHFAYLTVKKLLVGPRQVMLEVKDLISSHSRLSAFSADYLRQTSWPVCNTSLWWLEPEKADVWQPISQRLRGRREKKKKKKKGKEILAFTISFLLEAPQAGKSIQGSIYGFQLIPTQWWSFLV